jgi:hypothetical protein
MPIDIGGILIIDSSKQLAPDGSSSSYPARSGLDIKRNYPSKTSGLYWIQSEKMPNPLQMYVNLDSDCDGGGWDFYPISSGTSISTVNEIHSGIALGLDMVYPRSQGHWKAIYRYTNNVLGDVNGYNQTVSKIYATESTVVAGAYPTAPSLNGNYTSYIMRNPKYYETGAPDWKVPDGGRWWLSNSTFDEPNGDYYANAFLGLTAVGYSLNSDGSISGWNDGYGSYITGTKYLVSTNLKG